MNADVRSRGQTSLYSPAPRPPAGWNDRRRWTPLEFNTNLAEWVSRIRLSSHSKVPPENQKGSRNGCETRRGSTVPPPPSRPKWGAFRRLSSLPAPPRCAAREPVKSVLPGGQRAAQRGFLDAPVWVTYTYTRRKRNQILSFFKAGRTGHTCGPPPKGHLSYVSSPSVPPLT